MVSLGKLTIKNFMSVGNLPQSVCLDSNDLVLVLGENLDLGGNDKRNGVGKSSILNALSYAIYGNALTNIKKDNLINKVNLKNMLVTLDFTVDGRNYTVERGRKPNIFKFTETHATDPTQNKVTDESQGEGRHTQDHIAKLVGMSHDMFKHILALNTYMEPFLSLRAGDQRTLIEQLLGITQLSEKAERLREEMKSVKDSIREEEYAISATNDANKRIEQNIRTLISKSEAWVKQRDQKIDSLQTSITSLMDLDIQVELDAHAAKAEISELTNEFKLLSKEVKAHALSVANTQTAIDRLNRQMGDTVERKCPTCHQSMDSHTHQSVHAALEAQRSDLEQQLLNSSQLLEESQMMALSVDALIPPEPTTRYRSIEEAYNHKTTLDTLANSLSSLLESENPYTDQIESLKSDGLKAVDYTQINQLTKLQEHQDFLLKLLTNKDSFIRKKIIDQNLTYLNHRLSHYLAEIGLPHSVTFMSDLEVEISLYGKEFDFDNLSRGERTRLTLSLSWAFRDVFESMNSGVNLMFVDELLDTGLDTSGVESSLGILKRMSIESAKSVFLISHREELIGRVSNVLKVTKEKGFTSLSMS